MYTLNIGLGHGIPKSLQPLSIPYHKKQEWFVPSFTYITIRYFWARLVVTLRSPICLLILGSGSGGGLTVTHAQAYYDADLITIVKYFILRPCRSAKAYSI